MVEKSKSKPEHLLMEAIGFTEEDLEANREGYLSQRQRARLTAKRRSWTNLGILIVGIGFLFIVALMVDKPRVQDGVPNRVGVIGLICVGIAFGIYISRLNWRKYDADLLQGGFEIVEGRVQLDVTSEGNRSMSYRIILDGTRFNVTKPIFLAFKNGDPYCIYYAPHSKTMLSAEWLR